MRWTYRRSISEATKGENELERPPDEIRSVRVELDLPSFWWLGMAAIAQGPSRGARINLELGPVEEDCTQARDEMKCRRA